MGTLLWTYAILKAFAFDVDEKIVEFVLGSSEPEAVTRYRLLFFFVLAAVAAALARSRSAIVMTLVYVLLFPLIVLLWKIPRALYRSGSWIATIAALSALSSVVVKLRYAIIVSASALVAATVILSTSEQLLLVPAAIVIAVLLLVAYVRTAAASLRSPRFVEVQREAMRRVAGSGLVKEMTSIDAGLRLTTGKFSDTQQQAFVQSLGWGVFAHRALYFWAYQLQRYRQSPGSVLFAALGFVALFFQVVVSLALINTALDEIEPTAFKAEGDPSFATFIRYSISAMSGGEIDALTPVSDLASSISIAAVLLGAVGLGTLLLTLFQAFRHQRDEVAGQEAVDEIRAEGRRFELLLRSEYEISPREALDRLAQLRFSLLGMILFVSERIPPDFEDE